MNRPETDAGRLALSAVKDTVPITRFNRGQAGQVFDEVRLTGPKAVLKNNKAVCVLMSPEDYLRLSEGAFGCPGGEAPGREGL